MARVHHEPIRITTAAQSRDADIARRQRRYVASMVIRSVCFIGAVVAAVVGVTWLWPILIVGALVLPYVAVVMANAADTRGDTFRLDDQLFDAPQLSRGPDDRGPAA